MIFSDEYKVFVRNLHLLKEHGPMKLITDFCKKNWKIRGLDQLLNCMKQN